MIDGRKMTKLAVSSSELLPQHWVDYGPRLMPEILALVKMENRLKPICHFDPREIVKSNPQMFEPGNDVSDQEKSLLLSRLEQVVKLLKPSQPVNVSADDGSVGIKTVEEEKKCDRPRRRYASYRVGAAALHSVHAGRKT